MHLDEIALLGHHHVEVHVRFEIFVVAKIEQGLLADQPNAGCCHGCAQRHVVQRALAYEVEQRLVQRHVGARYRRRSRAAVCLQHVAVQRDRSLADLVELRYRTQ